MSIKTRAAAIVIAAATIGGGTFALPASVSGELAASAASATAYEKTPAAKTSYSSTDKDITIGWEKVGGATGYYIYRWSAMAPAWVRVGTAPAIASTYTDSKVIPGTSYKYYIVAYKKSGSKRIMSGRSNEIAACTKPISPSLHDAQSDSNYIIVSWDTVKCSGYEVSYKKSGGKWSSPIKLNSGSDNECTIKNLSPETSYSVRIRSFVKAENGSVVYSSYSSAINARTEPDFAYRRSSQYLIDRLDNAPRSESGNTYYECNRQGDTETKTLITLSDADMATVKRFVDAHYTSDMSVGEFLDYTVQWLNKNISYADGIHGPAYSEIWGRSHVDNCFNYRVGQCIQYNSAICAVMRYLGYDARVIQGWRGNSLDNKWQHFWCEVTINGKDYVMDSYNYGTDGDWYFVCATYEETAPYAYNSHYIMNKKLMAPFTGYSYVRNSREVRKIKKSN